MTAKRKKNDAEKYKKLKESKKSKRTPSEDELVVDHHPWLAATLKGHSGDITDLDWSSNEKYIASCAKGCISISVYHPHMKDNCCL